MKRKKQRTAVRPPVPSHGLPVVTTTTFEAIFAVYAGKKWGKHLNEFRDMLVLENPQLIKFIESQVGKHPQRMHNVLFEIVIGTLSVFAHQARIDNGDTAFVNIQTEQPQ